MLETDDGQPEAIDDLRVLYAAAKVDPETRTLHFYVTLPNPIDRDIKLDDGRRFVSGDTAGPAHAAAGAGRDLAERIVLPVDAVAQDGAETYVFTANGDHFDRRTVHVEYSDHARS